MIRTLGGLSGLGAVVCAAGFAVEPGRAWANLLLISFWLVCMGLAGSFFVALQYACGAGWAVSFRRIPEAMVAALPVGVAGLLLVFLVDPGIYPWVHHAGHEGFRSWWLNRPFFLARAVSYFVVWFLFAALLVRNSRRQDEDGALVHTRRNIRTSMIYIVVFALTFWLASVDWIMSLEPEWASTIFGIYNFAGMFAAGLAAIILLVLWSKQGAPLRDFIRDEHLHDLGKLLFAFSTFWMYIFFSQYMLIWYANVTEESVYYILRQSGILGVLFVANVVLNWGVPFLVLLSSAAKRNPAVLASTAIVVLVGRWLDLYLMIMPPLMHGKVAVPWMELGMMAGAMGVFGLAFLAWFRRAPQTPVRDPLLAQSLSYHS
jgi:MFS family permease